jgi:hypothetical protein
MHLLLGVSCKLLERNVFPQKEVGEFYNKNFINLDLIWKKEKVEILPENMELILILLYYLSMEMAKWFSKDGIYGCIRFSGMGKDVLNPENKIEKRIEKFHAGEKDPEFLLKLMKDVAKNDFAFGQKVSERYFQKRKLRIYQRRCWYSSLFYKKF